MVYPTLRATVRKGKIQLLDEVVLPENALLLVTVMDANALDSLSLGERMILSMRDAVEKRYTAVQTDAELAQHLDDVLGKE